MGLSQRAKPGLRGWGEPAADLLCMSLMGLRAGPKRTIISATAAGYMEMLGSPLDDDRLTTEGGGARVRCHVAVGEGRERAEWREGRRCSGR